MYCSKCGKPLEDDARFCDACGQPTAPAAAGASAAEVPPGVFVASLIDLKCPSCGSGNVKVKGVKGSLGKSVATGAAFGAIGSMVAGSNAAKNTATEPLQFKCGDCGNKFETFPLPAAPQDILPVPCTIIFERPSSFVGAAVPQIVWLNGVKMGAVKNGKSITFQTGGRYNTLFATDQFGVAFPSEYRFEAQPGGTITVRFNRKFKF